MLVSVIMSNYNTDIKQLDTAVNSILNQTFSDFEFIIVDDCSTDDSLEYLRKLDDKRIVLLENETNMGLTKSLNIALENARGKYIVRMDSDDISLPNRIERQVEFMQSHQNVIAAGTWVQYFGSKDILYKPVITSNDDYRANLLFSNSPTIVHPSAILNRELLLKNNVKYDERYRNAQDYKMWVDCSKYGTCVIIPEVLLRYRVHEKQISSNKDGLQNKLMKNIVKEQLQSIGIEPTDEELDFHINFFHQEEGYESALKWCSILIDKNRIYKRYSEKSLKKLISPKIQELGLKALIRGESVHFFEALPFMNMSNKIIFCFRIIKNTVVKGDKNANV